MGRLATTGKGGRRTRNEAQYQLIPSTWAGSQNKN
jgi:hypothetical protein